MILSAVIIFSCTKNNVAVDKDPLRVSYVQFSVPTGGASASTTKTVKLTAASGPLLLPLELTNVLAKDANVHFTFSSRNNAAQGVQFNAITDTVFKAGTVTDTLRVQGLFAGYAGGRIDTIKIKLSSVDVPNGVNDSINVIFKR